MNSIAVTGQFTEGFGFFFPFFLFGFLIVFLRDAG